MTSLKSILHPCIFLHRKIYGWRLVRECDVICCGPSCQVGFLIWQVWFCLWDYWFSLQTGSALVSLVVWPSDSPKQWAVCRMVEKFWLYYVIDPDYQCYYNIMSCWDIINAVNKFKSRDWSLVIYETCVCVRVVVLTERITSEDCLHVCYTRAEWISTC